MITVANRVLGTRERRPTPFTARSDRCSLRGAHLPLLGWLLLVAAGALLVYFALVAPGHKRLDAVPLHGAFDPRAGTSILLPAAVVAIATTAAPIVTRRLSWRRLLLVTWCLAGAWALSLASVRGWGRVTAVFERAGEYRAVLPRVESIGTFLGSYTDVLGTFPLHVQGHPPGFVLVSWGLARVGAPGSLPLALLAVVVGASAVPAALVAARAVADERTARAAAPFVAMAPAAVWVATSADAFFTGVGAWAVALVVLATVDRGHGARRRMAVAFAGGLLFGAVAFCSYGLVLLALVPLVVAVVHRRLGPLLFTACGALLVAIAFRAAGFWWLDGLAATRERYLTGIASERPYAVFLVADLSILAIALGPALAVALWRLRDPRLWLLVGGALLAVTLADLSGMSKSEVERIWLPFTPWILLASAVLGERITGKVPGLPRPGSATGWLVVQGSFALLIECTVRTAW